VGRRWKWFLRPGRVAVDLAGQAVPDGDTVRCCRRRAAEGRVPDGFATTSRCDGAEVYQRPEQARAGRAGNQRVRRHDRPTAAGRERGRR
jgi:hypothetical protein